MRISILFLLLNMLLPLVAQAEKFRIGVIFPLTGSSAGYGEAMRNAIQLALEENPEAMHNLEFVYEDSRNDAKSALTAFQKLTAADGVNLIFVWGVGPCSAVIPLAEARKVPTVAECYTRQISAGKKYVLRFMNSTEDYMRVLTAELERRGFRRLGMVLSEMPFIEEMYDGLQKELRAGQALQLFGRYHLTESDLRLPVSRARNAQIDALGVFLSLGQLAPFFRQAREQSLQTPTFGLLSYEDRGEIVAAAGAMEGALFAGNRVREEFLAHYRKRFGGETQYSFAAISYEFALLSGELFRNDVPRDAGEILRRYELPDVRVGKAVPSMRFVDTPGEGKHFEFPLTIKFVNGEGAREIGSDGSSER